MGSNRRSQEYNSPEPVRGPARGRGEGKRRRYYNESSRGRPSGGLRPTAIMAMAGIVLAVVVVALVALGPDETGPGAPLTASASTQGTQLVPATTGAVEDGKATVSLDEVSAKGMVYWDIPGADGKTTPLMAYFAPSGAAKVAVRICDGNCDDLSFRIEGKQIVCDACGTKWDAETIKGISGGCQATPPKLLPSRIIDGKLIADA